MPADRRLFDSSSMTPPPAPEIDAVTCTVGADDGWVDYDSATGVHIAKAKAAAERAGWRQHGFRFTHTTRGSYLARDMSLYDLCDNESIELWKQAS
ncbi:hypothetical protein CO669_30005 [Bradyrhizobium sp. Y36]|uniref:hypothetical protein n=1 Tax=Bradyrhizobium sp. Y36 TaxID=2035447 RepID=UPI000BEAA895|nr:hypothetical protein [Bradyrhizobium sp. Y36]PDT86079.1 hypothetical protein CO669_30005 [Bradyrhizobium sp. Y36]